MADASNGCPSFWTQANALLRKNFTFQKRNMKENIRLVIFPFLICVFLVLLQKVINNELAKPKNRCGCARADFNGDGQYEKICGIEFSTVTQAASCAIIRPPEWPPLLQVPSPMHRAVQPGESYFERCQESWSCPATFLLTGNNQSLGSSLSLNMLSLPSPVDFSDILYSLANNVLGSDTKPSYTNYLESAFSSHHPIYRLQSLCFDYSEIFVSIGIGSVQVPQEARCVDGQILWRSSSSEINRELYRGFWQGNSKGDVNEFVAAYDFLNSNLNNFNLSVWYNSTYKRDFGNGPIALTRVPRSVNLATNAYLQLLLGPANKILFEFVKEMPKPETQLRLDLASLLGPLFFTWVILQLFPVMLTSLVYEKQQKLRIMMKMHGLGDGPYWMISYAYFFVLSLAYMLCFVIFGSLIGLKFFTLNSFIIQFLFYFIYINLQISLAFLVASVFSNVKTAAVIGYIMVFGTGLLGGFLFQFFIQDTTFPRIGIIAMELYPGFSLFRGLYEFAQYAFAGNYIGGAGMLWSDLSDSHNGMVDVLIIMSVEWVVILFIAYCVDQVTLSKCGVRKSPLFFLQNLQKKSLSPAPLGNPIIEGERSQAIVQMEKPDVAMEAEKVKQLLLAPTMSRAIICHDLKKVYPGRDGNPEKFAVRGLSLSVSQGECFGMLGPNGAGKTSFINMMIGLMKPSSGAAYVQGLNIETRMDEIYTSMGVCPQHDLLWETLTGREHLLFYGRLKNLKGQVLSKAVEDSLRRVNLLHGGVADQRAGKYSGGMKRRLSVAISLIGDPKVVYMDEPSTGLDPASRNNLWNVIKQAKQKRAIILTTHSMEEADHLCDRLGIFADGSLQCIGNPNELKARYGGSYVLTMTTSSNHESEVEKLVENLSKNANKIYHLSGTQKFELPKEEVRIAEVFRAVSNAKSRFPVYAWGVADTTLEDVFIKVARGAQAFDVLS